MGERSFQVPPRRHAGVRGEPDGFLDILECFVGLPERHAKPGASDQRCVGAGAARVRHGGLEVLLQSLQLEMRLSTPIPHPQEAREFGGVMEVQVSAMNVLRESVGRFLGDFIGLAKIRLRFRDSVTVFTQLGPLRVEMHERVEVAGGIGLGGLQLGDSVRGRTG